MTVRLRCLSPRPMASLRLLCIPFAGAGVGAFRGWAPLLPADVEAFAVQLPGREDRLGESALTDWRRMLDALVEAVAQLYAQPTAIFGHSLGSIVGLALARRMQDAGCVPRHLFVSARPWPGLPSPSRGLAQEADDDGLLRALEDRYGALPPSLSHPDIREVVLPALRADLGLLDDYAYAPAAPLQCPLTAFSGRGDATTGDDAMSAWHRETAAAFDRETFDGGHFFIESHREALAAAITSRLRATATG